jgi:hypothetical protein
MTMRLLFVLVCLTGACVYANEILTGPELHLDYRPQAGLTNPVDCFMYFVPLTSPTSMTITTAPGTTFVAGLTSWKTERKDDAIHVQCDFQIIGEGVYCASYNPQEMIYNQLVKNQNAKEATELLEWIRLDGPCLGRIEGFGKVVNNVIQMENVEVIFNRDNSKSPVVVSIYDVPSKDGKFLFENRTHCLVARVNSLTFKRNNDRTPRMSVEIASLTRYNEKEGVISRITAMIVNVFSTTSAITPIGNTAMMDFGATLYQKQPRFTFPYASNIKTAQVSMF